MTLLLLLLCCCFRKPEPELHAAKHTTTTLAFVAAGYRQKERERTAGSFAYSLLPRSHSFPMVQNCYFTFWHLEKNAFYNSGTSVPNQREQGTVNGPLVLSLARYFPDPPVFPRSEIVLSFPRPQKEHTFLIWERENKVPITGNKVPCLTERTFVGVTVFSFLLRWVVFTAFGLAKKPAIAVFLSAVLLLFSLSLPPLPTSIDLEFFSCCSNEEIWN